MDVQLTFITPRAPVQQARLAMTRLQRHLATVIGPLDPCTDLTGMAMAFMSLEGVHPAYEPLPLDIAPATNPQADLDVALAALRVAMADASTAADKLRYALTIRDLQDLDSVRPSDSAADPDLGGAAP